MHHVRWWMDECLPSVVTDLKRDSKQEFNKIGIWELLLSGLIWMGTYPGTKYPNNLTKWIKVISNKKMKISLQNIKQDAVQSTVHDWPT